MMVHPEKPLRLFVLLSILAVSIVLLILVRPFRDPDREEKMIRDFTLRYRQIHPDARWLGTLIQQTPTDMWAIQDIMVRQNLDFVIETGTLKGGSALYFATVFHAFKESGRVITVNLRNELDPATENMPVFKEHVIQIIGDAASEATVRKIEAIVQGRPALVLIDDYHGWRHVAEELPLYARFIKKGGYMVLHDTNYDTYAPQKEFPDGGPLKAARKFLADGAPFQMDRNCENYMLTYCPMGFLKRVRD